MSTALRREDKNLVQQLLDEPFRFEFSQAVSILLRWFDAHGISRDKALTEYLRFDNSLSLSFAASEIERLQAIGDGDSVVQSAEALSIALARQGSLQIHITPAFMGLLGAQGALPFHYTERVSRYQLDHKDEGPRAFLDMFANRTLGLWYEAWCKHRVECAVNGEGDTFLPLLTALTGFTLEQDNGFRCLRAFFAADRTMV